MKNSFNLVLQQCGNIKLTENGRIHKMFHVIDIEKLLDINNLDEFLDRKIFLHNIYIYIYTYIYKYIYIYIYIYNV